jgi:hypothetical protein
VCERERQSGAKPRERAERRGEGEDPDWRGERERGLGQVRKIIFALITSLEPVLYAFFIMTIVLCICEHVQPVCEHDMDVTCEHLRLVCQHIYVVLARAPIT